MAIAVVAAAREVAERAIAHAEKVEVSDPHALPAAPQHKMAGGGLHTLGSGGRNRGLSATTWQMNQIALSTGSAAALAGWARVFGSKL
ncbi:hypothetical protein OG302_43150 [Streptomyces sp. NBC_01283]|uniref:hypothetical protein n=1 Tax=Streptomyces sp. NBC_01283 TaxID=2903812 RepID=UPI00352D5A3A|nr:hypothetical protein OG302_43150 [Streptomyces sp. NBC_01283]